MTLPLHEPIDTPTRREAARAHHAQATEDLIRVTEQLAFEKLAAVFPGAHTLKMLGDEEGSEFSPRCRLQKILNRDGRVLFNVEDGAETGAQEETVDEVDTELFDVLIELAFEEYIGECEITAESVAS